MLILHLRNRQVVIPTTRRPHCASGELVGSYVRQALTPAARDAFELHLIECPTCLGAVQLESLAKRATCDHKTSGGGSCATQVRRKR